MDSFQLANGAKGQLPPQSESGFGVGMDAFQFTEIMVNGQLSQEFQDGSAVDMQGVYTGVQSWVLSRAVSERLTMLSDIGHLFGVSFEGVLFDGLR